MAGAYDIAHHFRHEALRGVEWASAMWRVMGGHAHFERFSPLRLAHRLLQLTSARNSNNSNISNSNSNSSNSNDVMAAPLLVLPHVCFTLVHGLGDIVVPVASTLLFAHALHALLGSTRVHVRTVDANHAEVMLALHHGSAVPCTREVRAIVSRTHAALQMGHRGQCL